MDDQKMIREEKIRQKEALVLDGTSTAADEQSLSDLYFMQAHHVQSAALALAAGCQSVMIKGGTPFGKSEYCAALIDILDHQSNIYIMIESADQGKTSWSVLVNCLSNIGAKVYYIRKPIDMETERLDYTEKDLVNVAMNNREMIENIIYLTPLRLKGSNVETVLDTTGRLVAYIATNHQSEGRVLLLADKKSYDSLTFETRIAALQISANATLGKDMIMLYRVGPYIPMYSEIYKFDIGSILDAPNTCKISIVIATRNCPGALRYTLLSCLDQTYEDYEIVLSDNGDFEDGSVHVLAQEMNTKCIAEGRNPKIRYYRTPAPLSLPKSFEFAYLHARGEFLFGLGSDDAIMPDSLKILARCLDENPGHDVIRWIRNSYYWPDMPDRSKNLLVYNPIAYQRGEFTVDRVKSYEILWFLFSRPTAICRLLPLCYINSGMRRHQMKRIINKTGTLIGGASQDIYLGVLNLYMTDEILFMEYPLTIAGLSGKSIGVQAHRGVRTTAESKAQTEEWSKLLRIIEPDTPSQAKMPLTNLDTTVFVNQLLKVQDLHIGKLPEDDKINFKALFKSTLEMVSPQDIRYPIYVNSLLMAAKIHGRHFYRWFKPLTEKAIQARDDRIREEREAEESASGRAYEISKEPDKEGFIKLDASEYGISDIYAAARFIDEKWRLFPER